MTTKTKIAGSLFALALVTTSLGNSLAWAGGDHDGTGQGQSGHHGTPQEHHGPKGGGEHNDHGPKGGSHQGGGDNDHSNGGEHGPKPPKGGGHHGGGEHGTPPGGGHHGPKPPKHHHHPGCGHPGHPPVTPPGQPPVVTHPKPPAVKPPTPVSNPPAKQRELVKKAHGKHKVVKGKSTTYDRDGNGQIDIFYGTDEQPVTETGL